MFENVSVIQWIFLFAIFYRLLEMEIQVFYARRLKIIMFLKMEDTF